MYHSFKKIRHFSILLFFKFDFFPSLGLMGVRFYRKILLKQFEKVGVEMLVFRLIPEPRLLIDIDSLEIGLKSAKP